MDQYHELLATTLSKGDERSERTGTGTLSLFAPPPLVFDLNQGFPLVTTKKVPFKAVAAELIWFLRGDTNIKWLNDHGVHIWDQWADKNGELGPIYGSQWRSWRTRAGVIDQIGRLIDMIKEDPTSRRMVVSAWNVGELSDMALPPCHALFQFYIEGGRLSCQIYQRSADLFIGVPFNIASYALLTHIIAHLTDLNVGTLTHVLGDAHIYLNHKDAVHELMAREPRDLPAINISKDLETLSDVFCDEILELISLDGYDPHPTIAAQVAV